MAEAVLNQVDVKNMFDLRGVVAVVTGGGTVSMNFIDGTGLLLLMHFV